MAVLALCARATERVAIDEAAMQRAIDLRLHGLRDLDALHLACAERSGVEVLVTTDDAFISASISSKVRLPSHCSRSTV